MLNEFGTAQLKIHKQLISCLGLLAFQFNFYIHKCATVTTLHCLMNIFFAPHTNIDKVWLSWSLYCHCLMNECVIQSSKHCHGVNSIMANCSYCDHDWMRLNWLLWGKMCQVTVVSFKNVGGSISKVLSNGSKTCGWKQKKCYYVSTV